MQKSGQVVLATILIGLGVVLLAANYLRFDIRSIFWPLLLVVLGLVLIFRPTGVEGTFKPFGLERFGSWRAEDADYWMFVGEVDLDYTDADLPEGETSLQIGCFVADVELRIPSDVGVRLDTSAFVTDSNINGDKTDHIGTGASYQSPNFEAAAKKLVIEVKGFVVSLKLRHTV